MYGLGGPVTLYLLYIKKVARNQICCPFPWSSQSTNASGLPHLGWLSSLLRVTKNLRGAIWVILFGDIVTYKKQDLSCGHMPYQTLFTFGPLRIIDFESYVMCVYIYRERERYLDIDIACVCVCVCVSFRECPNAKTTNIQCQMLPEPCKAGNANAKRLSAAHTRGKNT